MKIIYYIDSLGNGRIINGTPAQKQVGDDLTLMFDVQCSSAHIYFGGKRYAVCNGVVTIPYTRISKCNNLLLQYAKKDGSTCFAECESLFERDGYLYGQKETLDSFCKLKHATVALMKASEELEARTAALERKCAELEHKLNGTDIFDLNEQEKEK